MHVCLCVCALPVDRWPSILFWSRQLESAHKLEAVRCANMQFHSWCLTWKCMAALQEVRGIKDDVEKPEEETENKLTSVRYPWAHWNKGWVSCKGRDDSYSNKHIYALRNRKVTIPSVFRSFPLRHFPLGAPEVAKYPLHWLSVRCFSTCLSHAQCRLVFLLSLK